MHTRCPDCQTRYPITPAQLRAGRGEARCENCNSVFDALATLEHTAPETIPLLTPRPGQELEIPTLKGLDRTRANDPDELSGLSLTAGVRPGSRQKAPNSPRQREDKRPPTPAPDPPASHSPLSALTLALLLLLWGQYLYFESEQLLKNTRLRPWLEQACGHFGCSLPPYRDLDVIKTGPASLQKAAHQEEAYEFRVVMRNESSLPQPFPALRLILAEVDGKILAERVFKPTEYLSIKVTEDQMLTGKLYEARLLMTPPDRSIGSYRFNMM